MSSSLLYTGFSVLVAFLCGLWGAVNAVYIDWSIFGIAFLCLVPALVLLDLAALLATFRALGQAPCTEGDKRERALARLASLLGLHLATAVFAIILLAIPASSVLVRGVVLFQLRAVFLSLVVFSIMTALPLPYRLLRAFLALLPPAAAPGTGDFIVEPEAPAPFAGERQETTTGEADHGR